MYGRSTAGDDDTCSQGIQMTQMEATGSPPKLGGTRPRNEVSDEFFADLIMTQFGVAQNKEVGLRRF